MLGIAPSPDGGNAPVCSKDGINKGDERKRDQRILCAEECWQLPDERL